MAYTPEHSPLGKAVAYASHYDPTLIFTISRAQTRQILQIDQSALPFTGVDIWNGYELSWLNARGKPQVALAQFVIPCESPNIVESKSFKLYLNSFNQSRFESANAVLALLEQDLSKGFGASVSIILTPASQFHQVPSGELIGTVIDELDIDIDTYTPDANLLQLAAGNRAVSEVLVSHLLKSNCPVTSQPDWATLQISYTGAAIDHASLLRYVVSFRNHNEFHEQCVERIFTDLLRQLQPTELTVYARYTRRGGLDINPMRTTQVGFALPFNGKSARQ
ncbi:NADPH-dependent 7-cyano-7-deazaguanine reductase QueF [Ampullimonas aquatilis]|uniref:NADPH-dependent 7-cyano-7-deazaguanine reductase QueF n=1 Tax=Ampullimonas aquatilis TaxID=1341549 RepID=UPI003C7610C8